MNPFNDDRNPGHASLFVTLSGAEYEWRGVREMPAQPLHRLAISVGNVFPGAFERADGWTVPGTVLDRLASLRRFTDVQQLRVAIKLGAPVSQTTMWALERNPNLEYLPAIVDAFVIFVRGLSGLQELEIDLGELDPAGTYQERLVRAAPTATILQVTSALGVRQLLSRLPPHVRSLSVPQAGQSYQVVEGMKTRRVNAPTLSAEQLAEALGGHRLDALSTILDEMPRRSAAVGAMLRPLRFLGVDFTKASQRDIDAFAAYLGEMKGLRGLDLRVGGKGLHRGGGYDLTALALALAGLQLERAYIDLATDWLGPRRWSYQHVLLLNALLRSERLVDAYPSIDFPLRGMAGVGEYGDTLIRAVQTYGIAFGRASLPPEMLVGLSVTTGGYPEWFLIALREPLANVVPYLRGRQERGGYVGFFVEEREETESEDSEEDDLMDFESDEEE